MAGSTGSTDFPGTAGGAQAAPGNAFVARLNAALTMLDQATYLGGSNNDYAEALAIHPTPSDVYVDGYTWSTDFPGTAGGAQAAFGGGLEDAFVARLNAALTTLDQATYLGGSDRDHDFGGALAIHPTTGDVYVAGETLSADFPGTAFGAQSTLSGLGDAFVTRLTADLAGPPPRVSGRLKIGVAADSVDVLNVPPPLQLNTIDLHVNEAGQVLHRRIS